MRAGARSGAAIWGGHLWVRPFCWRVFGRKGRSKGAFQGGVSNDFLKFGFCFWA